MKEILMIPLMYDIKSHILFWFLKKYFEKGY